MIINNRKIREAANVRDAQYILNTSSKFQIRFNELVTKEGKRPIYASKPFQQEPHIEMLKGRGEKTFTLQIYTQTRTMYHFGEQSTANYQEIGACDSHFLLILVFPPMHANCSPSSLRCATLNQIPATKSTKPKIMGKTAIDLAGKIK